MDKNRIKEELYEKYIEDILVLIMKADKKQKIMGYLIKKNVKN